ncbi:MAG: hypothetical protein M1830_004575 [Pleopsidium flavum]|nr:MAG: hypothetical protein M1830_004575 [Pleopsidium flavum]
MTSIDILSGVATKPGFALADNDFATLKSVKEVATLEPQTFKDLLEAIHQFVADNIEECGKTPRSLKKTGYQDLVDSFLSDNAKDFWDEDRTGCNKVTHLVWPDDQEKIRFLSFMLIKQESVKQWTKKRKESGSDEKDDGSKGSSTPPPAKKSKVTDATKKSTSLSVDSSHPPSMFGVGTAAKKVKHADDGSTTEENTPEDDRMEDSIIVQVKGDTPPVKKVTGDPLGQVRDAHKAQKVPTGTSISPSPAPKPERKLASKPVVKEATELKFNVTAPGHSEGAELARKPSDFAPRAKVPAKVTPSTKVIDGKNLMEKTSTTTVKKVAKSVEPIKNTAIQGKVVLSTPKLPAHGEKGNKKTTMSQAGASSPERQLHREPNTSLGSSDLTQLSKPPAQNRVLKGTAEEVEYGKFKSELLKDATNAVEYLGDLPSLPSSAVSGMSAAHHEEVAGKIMDGHSFIDGQDSAAATHAVRPSDSIEHIFGVPESEGPDPQSPTLKTAGANSISVEVSEDDFTSGYTDLLRQDDADQGITNGGRDMTVSNRTVTPIAHNNNLEPSTHTNSVLPFAPAVSSANNHNTAATASPYLAQQQIQVFMITISPHPDQVSSVTESICLTFPFTTSWSSFYGRVALEITGGDNPGDKAAFAGASKCKVRVPGHAQGNSRLFRFGIMPPAAESIWANVMRMVARDAEGGEAVEVTFFA